MPAGPRCLRWSVVKLSGPIAVELRLLPIAVSTDSGVNGVKLLSSLCFWCIRRIIRLVLGSVLCVVVAVNCLLNLFAMDCCLVKVLFWKLMGWFGGWFVRFPDSERMRFQNFLRFVLWVALVILSFHVSAAVFLVRVVICSLRRLI